jgi:hypothetical protein
VDSPTGKKCRKCAQNRNHLTESTSGQVLAAFAAAILVAIPGGYLAQQLGFVLILAPLVGAGVGEAALRAGKRKRSLAMQVAAGAAALIGGLGGACFRAGPEDPPVWVWQAMLNPWALVVAGVISAVAVSRVRYL